MQVLVEDRLLQEILQKLLAFLNLWRVKFCHFGFDRLGWQVGHKAARVHEAEQTMKVFEIGVASPGRYDFDDALFENCCDHENLMGGQHIPKE